MHIAKMIGAALVVAGGGWLGSAPSAQALECPVNYNNMTSFDTVTLTINPGTVSCAGAGDDPQSEGDFIDNYTLIAKRNTPGSDQGLLNFNSVIQFTDDDGTDLEDDAWDGWKDGSGTAYFDFMKVTGYENIVLLFKFGGGQSTPSWFAFNVTNEDFSGSWLTTASTGLSHVSVLGTAVAIPLPASSVLLLGMIGAGLFAARQKKRLAA
jgi:hypothetical protein